MSEAINVAGIVPTWTLPDRMRKAREVAGMSQTQLATVTGISRRSISAYESGDSKPRRPQLITWALATGVRLDWLCPEQDSNLQPTDHRRRHLQLVELVA